jgi:hypothetical protein
VIYGHGTPDGVRDSILLRTISIALLAEWGVSVISFLVAQKIVRKQDPKNLLRRGTEVQTKRSDGTEKKC